MALSYHEYTDGGTGPNGLGQNTFSIPFNYISINDVRVRGYYVGTGGATWTADLTITSDATANTVTLTGNDPTTAGYSKIRLYRVTTTQALIDFQNGSRLSESDLDTAYQQSLFCAQEVSEAASGLGQPLQGDAGPQGPTGATGATGATGPQGPAGSDATGGKVLQVLSTTKTTPFTTTSSSPTDITGMSVSITPSATTSKILVMFHAGIVGNTSGGQGTELYLVRDTAYIHQGDADGNRVRVTAARNGSAAHIVDSISFQHLDTPSTTSQVTYKVQIATQDSGTATFLRRGDDADGSSYPRAAAEITVMEIAG